MARRTITDCDRCPKENINEEGSYRLELAVKDENGNLAAEKKRVDLCVRCLGEVLQSTLANTGLEHSDGLYKSITERGTTARRGKKTAA